MDEYPPGQTRAVAQLSVRRGTEAIAFYARAFGVEVVYQFGGTRDNEEVVAQLDVAATSFWVEDESPEHGNFSPESLGGSTTRMLLVVDDPDAVWARAVSAGAREVYAVSEQYGWRIGRVVDPYGHHWEIGRPLTPWPPA